MEITFAISDKIIQEERISVHRFHWLEELHTVHYATLLKLAQNRLRHLTGNIDEAEDVVQDAFLLAAEKDIRHLENPLAWLMKAISNLCMQRMSRIKRDKEKEKRFIQDKMDKNTDRSVYAVERQESETGALLWLMLLEQSLSPEEWELLRKHALEGIPIESLAREMNVSTNRLYVRIHRARKKLEQISQGM